VERKGEKGALLHFSREARLLVSVLEHDESSKPPVAGRRKRLRILGKKKERSHELFSKPAVIKERLEKKGKAKKKNDGFFEAEERSAGAGRRGERERRSAHLDFIFSA